MSEHEQVRCRGVRGATVVDHDTPEHIRDAIRELVGRMVNANGIDPSDLAAAWFTTTPDLRSSYPAETARHMGWSDVPMLGATEMDKVGGMDRCIRVLLLWNTARTQAQVQHVYLRGTEALRTPGPEEGQ